MMDLAKGDRIVGAGHGGRSEFEIAWANNRPLSQRTPPVAEGDRVLYRSNDWAEPAWAVVVALLPGETAHPDPWPPVILRIDPGRIPESWDKRQRALANRHIQTWEARLEGSAGYLHPHWARYPQPHIGAGMM